MSSLIKKLLNSEFLPPIMGGAPEPEPEPKPEPEPEPEPDDTVTLSKTEYESLQTQLQTATDLLGTMRPAFMAATATPAAPREPELSDDDWGRRFLENPRKVLRGMAEAIKNDLRGEYTAVEQYKAAKDAFYVNYPDLGKYQTLVYAVAQEVEAELGNSRTVAQKFEETARRARAFLEDVSREKQTPSEIPPRVASSNKARPAPRRTETPKPKTEEETAADYLKWRTSVRERRRLGVAATQ